MRNTSQQTSFLPDFCGTRIVFVVIILAELLAIILTLARSPIDADYFFDLAIYSLFIQWIALSCVGVLCLCRPLLDGLSELKLATVAYLITLLVSFIITECAWYLFGNWSAENGFIASTHGLFISKSMGISAIVSALALRYFYVWHQWGRKIKSESESRFQALQSRIRPHFLFNSMNTIASLTRRDPGLAEQVIEDLSDLFRVTLNNAGTSNTLKDEIELCKRYLRIEQQRLGNRLQVEWQLEDLPLDIKFPVLIIQPLLENAIYHGIELLPQGGTITIKGEAGDRFITIRINNPLSDASPDKNQGNHLAQDNVIERLTTLYNQPDLLQVSNVGDHYQVIIRIPYPDEDINRR